MVEPSQRYDVRDVTGVERRTCDHRRPKNELVTFRLRRAERQRLEAEAEGLGVSLSWLIRVRLLGAGA
jgi:hypothetical protein